MFVKGMRGEHWPLSRVEQLWEGKNDEGRKVDYAEIADFGKVILFYGEVRRVVEETARPFPAQPGTFVLEEFEDEEGTAIWTKVPVLAWIISSERGVLPVTIEGINHDSDKTQAILTPTGQVMVAQRTVWDSEGEYRLDILNERQRQGESA